MVAKTEATLILDKLITTRERNRQHQVSKTEAKVGRTRVLPISQRQRLVPREKNSAVAINEIRHLRNAKIDLNVGVQINSNEIARI